MDDCWNRIGVSGDRSCSELQAVVHCRNCRVYSQAGRSLLERQPPADYLSGWTAVLAEGGGAAAAAEQVVAGEQTLSLMVFRLGQELLALPLRLLQEVTPPFGIHSVPHRSQGCFLGLVNIRGEILLAASLHHLLGIAAEQPAESGPGARMVVTTPGPQQWVMGIDEVLGIHLCAGDDLQPPPVQHCATEQALTQALFSWNGRQVALLDGERLLQALQRQVSPA